MLIGEKPSNMEAISAIYIVMVDTTSKPYEMSLNMCQPQNVNTAGRS